MSRALAQQKLDAALQALACAQSNLQAASRMLGRNEKTEACNLGVAAANCERIAEGVLVEARVLGMVHHA